MELDFLQSPRLQQLQNQMQEAEQEKDKRRFLAMLVKEIINAIQQNTVTKIEGGVEVNNLDSITASLRNELAKANKPIRDLLTKLNLNTEQQTDVIKQLEEKAVEDFNEQYQTVIVKRVRDQVEVTNLQEIILPNEYSVNNLKELEPYFKAIEDKLASLDLTVNVPAPNVTVQPTAVNIPQTVIPEVNFEPLIKEIERNLKLLRTNNKSNPLAVRLTDGADWIKELRAMTNQQKQAVQFMSDLMYLRDATGSKINPARDESVSAPTTIGDGSKTVTTAGTRVTLGTGVCRYVIITANASNTNNIYVGGSAVAAGRGRPLVALQSEKIDINDLSKVYIDADTNGEGVSFVYVA